MPVHPSSEIHPVGREQITLWGDDTAGRIAVIVMVVVVVGGHIDEEMCYIMMSTGLMSELKELQH